LGASGAAAGGSGGTGSGVDEFSVLFDMLAKRSLSIKPW